jgi:hypothetical protein
MSMSEFETKYSLNTTSKKIEMNNSVGNRNNDCGQSVPWVEKYRPTQFDNNVLVGV